MSDRVSFYRKHVALSDNDIKRYAPSVFADAPAQGVSDKYCFIPTTEVLRLFREDGWVPVYAAQSRCRNPDGSEYAKHVLRFQQPNDQSLTVGDSLGEIIVTNSHNGTSSYRLMGGIYRLICSNGMAVADSTIESVRIRHAGFRDEEVKQAIAIIRERMPIVAQHITAMRDLKLTAEQRNQFAIHARELRWDAGKAPVEASALLQPRRPEDNRNDLWATLNVVQENIIQGGVQGRSGGTKPRRMTTREVASVSGGLRLNTGLWELAEAFLLAA